MHWKRPVSLLLFSSIFHACTPEAPQEIQDEVFFHTDQPFLQEFHHVYIVDSSNTQANDVRAIECMDNGETWIATADGVFRKTKSSAQWTPIIEGAARGPSYDVHEDVEGNVWLATWNGIYRWKDQQLIPEYGPGPPIAKITSQKDIVYAFGPRGIWEFGRDGWKEMDLVTGRSMRAVLPAKDKGFFLSTDVGLYAYHSEHLRLFRDTADLISCYVRGIDYSPAGNLWIGGLGGITVHDPRNHKLKEIRPADGLPSAWVTVVKQAPNGRMWVGTEHGLSRFWEGEKDYSVRHSRRWLVDNRVADLDFDLEGNAWIATANGVSVIRRREMTLEKKADYFYDQLIRRHVRPPWIVARSRLVIPGDTTTIEPEDDDNDGEYTALYLAMESFRFAVTKDPLAKERAKKAFNFLKYLQEVTGTDGFFARTIIPSGWTSMHDPNRSYSARERADQLVENPRSKFVENRWRKSVDGAWWWKGDTSSDELCGHMFGYFFYHLLVADEEEKKVVAAHVSRIMDHLLKNDFNLTDLDGSPTRWGVWSPEKLNHDPDWGPESALNSLEILSFLKFAHAITGNEKYQQAYLYLIEDAHYLENVKRMHSTNPAWFTYFDIYLALYVYPALLKYEEEPGRQAFYQEQFETWFQLHHQNRSPLVNFMYNYFSGGAEELSASILFLQDAPLDLVDWRIDNASREDLRLVRAPVLEELQTDQLRPPSEYRTIRWDRNPWEAVAGNPVQEREPVYWLLPYWMGRYLNLIRVAEYKQ